MCNKKYETIIGLEVHVELATKTKIFCGCSTEFGGMPNTHICPVCTGMPGALPVLNKKVVEYAIAVGLATNCEIASYSVFDRKNYFYPDNPQNYQISQLYTPICRNGFVEIESEMGKRKIRIHEIHMEEDAGKLIHGERDSLIDYNRSGIPLIEIVSEPDMRSSKDVIAYLEKLRLMIQYLGVSDCKLQEGSMRADVNLSVRPVGQEQLGTRTEMKNLNSFKAIARAIESEQNRQIVLLEQGMDVVQETRRWDEGENCSYSMRSKEDAKDYRYFPDPDLTPLYIDEKWIAQIKAREPEFKDSKMLRYERNYHISKYDADLITNSRVMANLFEETISYGSSPKKVANWLIGETMRLLKEDNGDVETLKISPKHLADIIAMVDRKIINYTVAKDVFEKMFREQINPNAYIEEHGLKMVFNEDVLLDVVKQVMASYPQSVSDYRLGKKKAMGFLVGQTMKQMKGKAEPSIVNKMVKELLDAQ